MDEGFDHLPKLAVIKGYAIAIVQSSDLLATTPQRYLVSLLWIYEAHCHIIIYPEYGQWIEHRAGG